MNNDPATTSQFARSTPRGLDDAAILVLYREALALVASGQVERIEQVLIDWAPCHIDRFADLHRRSA